MYELFAEIGDLVFTIAIGYISAIEFLYVVRHLYHYSCNHDANGSVDSNENVSQLQDSMRKQLENAKNIEAIAGLSLMKDGVANKDGFRVEDQPALIYQLKEQLKDKELSDLKRKELEKELAKHTKIAERLRKELAEAEAKFQRQFKQEEEAKTKKLLDEQRKREQEEQDKKKAEKQVRKLGEAICEEQVRREAKEQALKLIEAEQQREAELRQQKEAEQHASRLEEVEKENEQRMLEERELEDNILGETQKQQEVAEAEENARCPMDIEKVIKEQQVTYEASVELAAKNLLAIEHQLEEQLRTAEKESELTEKERQLIDSIKSSVNDDERNKRNEDELLRKILKTREQLDDESEEEQFLRLVQREKEQKSKKKRIEENALLFLEAEKEMAELQSQVLEVVERKVFRGGLDSAPQSPIIDEICIKQSISPLSGEESTYSRVKTQLAQDIEKSYSVHTNPLIFFDASDDDSSIDPASSQKSSFSTQPSEEITTGTDSQYPPLERQKPDGEDNNLIHQQYSDDYLRSLDGIKQRPLVREDGSGRRRAFKKRRSSNSSTSSRESRQSRDEELKMFTSLEEEEMNDTADSEFTPIRYSTDRTLRVKGHHRRHKISPAKDMRRGDDSIRNSLECLGEETSDAWGEVKPEHYKNTEFWKRKKTVSIDEETEFEKSTSSEETAYNTATNLPSASSFEGATQKQNQDALSALQKHSSQRNTQESKSDEQANIQQTSARNGNTNLESSINTEEEAKAGHSSICSSLRLSPRKEEEQKSPSSTVQSTPIINVQTPLDYESWRDEHGLLMEGISDFYDFTASVNPSRSRPVYGNVSPANTAPNTSLPKDVSFQLNLANKKIYAKTSVEIYDDAGAYIIDEFKKDNIIKFIDLLSGKEGLDKSENGNKTIETEVKISQLLKNVADDPSANTNEATLIPLVNIIEDTATGASSNLESNESSDVSMNTLVSSLRSQQTYKSHSRSKSPLPTADNLKRSVENRRYKMIKHNEDILEKLIESKLLPKLTSSEEEEIQSKNPSRVLNMADSEPSLQREVNPSVLSIQVYQRRSRSKSPMHLPTPENLSRGLDKRRSKLIERNDELIRQLEECSQAPETPTVVVEHVYKIESTEDIHTYVQSKKIISSNEEDNCTKEQMNLLVQSLRVARSKTRSKSPFTIQVQNANESSIDTPTVSLISTNFSEVEDNSRDFTEKEVLEDCSHNNMHLLAQSLRVARSKSTSIKPMLGFTLIPHVEERAKSPEPSAINSTDTVRERCRHSLSKSPFRSHSVSPVSGDFYRSNMASRSLSPPPDEYDEYFTILSLNQPKSKTLSADTFFRLTSQQKQLDTEALEKLKNASEELDLKTSSALIVKSDEFNGKQSQDHLTGVPLLERAKLLKESPATLHCARTVSEEVRDNERIKQEMLAKGFKRSTYVGESMDLGSEFEPLRKEAAKSQRSHSSSPLFSTTGNATAQRNAEEKRKIQDIILQELATKHTGERKEYKSTGSIPNKERYTSCEIEPSPSSKLDEIKVVDDIYISSNFQNVLTSDNIEKMRRRNAEFRRSASASRSPLRETQEEKLSNIEVEVAKRDLQDKILHEVSCSSFKFQGIPRSLNTNSFNNGRRASASALIQLPEILVQLIDDDDMEPEEYHHYRRFSLAQEELQEQYSGDDYIFIQQVEVRTRSGSRTWLREDFYSENLEDYLKHGQKSKKNSVEKEDSEIPSNEQQQTEDINAAESLAVDADEEYSNASDDDRQTVVEVDDEIDEDISDFNERGPAEESHHEISECEEAEREVDHYAGREASDWDQTAGVENVFYHESLSNQIVSFEESEGAVGGFGNSPYDLDSFAIDQIYDEAIKNRKQSGILREYDNILRQMSSSSDIDEQNILWSKTNTKKTPKNIELNTTFLDNDRKQVEMRYLVDANTTARQSARLHYRYGYKPILQAQHLEDDMELDLNYKPKREYNWRKNFKLDDDVVNEDKDISVNEIYSQQEKFEHRIEKHCEKSYHNEEIDQIGVFQPSLAEECVTLFSRIPERILDSSESAKEKTREGKHETCEKQKKKKTNKKSHKEPKASFEKTVDLEDEEIYDNQVYSRRSSSIQMETESPKRKFHSRRSSKSSLTNEDSLGRFSPHSSDAGNENIEDIMQEYTEVAMATTRSKKMKKRKKVKEILANMAESSIENRQEIQFNSKALVDIPLVSATITPESSSFNILASLSPQNSVFITPASIVSDINLSTDDLQETITSSTATTTDCSPSSDLSRTSSKTTAATVDTFDILKDANFYPLF